MGFRDIIKGAAGEQPVAPNTANGGNPIAAQLHFDILAYDDVKCSECGEFRKATMARDGTGANAPNAGGNANASATQITGLRNRIRKRRYYIDYRDTVLARIHRYQETNREAVRERARQRYAANHDAWRQYRAANADSRYFNSGVSTGVANPDAIRERMRS